MQGIAQRALTQVARQLLAQGLAGVLGAQHRTRQIQQARDGAAGQLARREDVFALFHKQLDDLGHGHFIGQRQPQQAAH